MFKLEFSTDNAAFADPDKAPETGRILTMVSTEVWAQRTSGTIQDYNGNTIGKWSLTKEG